MLSDPLALLVLTTGLALAQPRPSFDAASIKPTTERPLPNYRVTPGRFSVKSVSLRDLILRAYGIQRFQLSSGPAWMESEGFEIEATAGEAASADQMNAMLRTLLEDRFQLRIHSETRNVPVYLLKAGKDGAKLTRTGEADVRTGPASTDRMVLQIADSIPALVAHSNSRTGPAALGRPVVDGTGLEGNFKIRLEFENHPNPEGTGGRIEIDYPSELPKQLGLRLEPAKADIQFWIVDSAQKPAAN